MIITILIFIVVLGLLVFVHEFGHFIVAKKSGMVVEEFGFGFPPRLFGFQKINGRWNFIFGNKSQIHPSESDTLPGDGSASKAGRSNGENLPPEPTIYSINWIPLGGFVKIRGENNEDAEDPNSFVNKGFWPRFLTLVAGVCMNVILAWLLLSIGFMIGLPTAVNSLSDIPANTTLAHPQVTILDTVPNLPAAQAGLKADDIVLNIDGQTFSQISQIQEYVKQHAGSAVNFDIKRGRQELNIKITPLVNPPKDSGPTGIVISLVGQLSYPWYQSFWEGAKATYGFMGQMVFGLYHLVTSKPSLDSVGGPIKVAQLTRQAADMGFIYLLQFAAFLSLNLAVFNILPFPALDGGRVLFLIIEAIRGKKNNQQIEQILNVVGFIFLLSLVGLISAHEFINLFK